VELSKLKQLVETLRALGVTKYKHEGTEIELGEPVYVPPPVDLNKDGFTGSTRSPALQAALDRLDATYSDPALFDIRGRE
jgi:hypothetical protein